jgi:glycine cleavage system H protein
MVEVNNCLIPEDLYYAVADNVWAKVLEDGTVRIGMTDVAQTMAGAIIHCRPQKPGKEVKKGRSLATVESGKWVGPVKSPLTGKIVEANGHVEAQPAILNKSPYKEGWIVRLEATNLQAELAEMVQGAAAVEGIRAYMAEKGVGACIHCEGFNG